jgi:type I restriction enzyme M protein
MAKTTDEIRELLASELFRKGIAKKHTTVNDDYTTIHYNCKNKTKRRLQNPEEFVQITGHLQSIRAKAMQLRKEAGDVLEKAKINV